MRPNLRKNVIRALLLLIVAGCAVSSDPGGSSPISAPTTSSSLASSATALELVTSTVDSTTTTAIPVAFRTCAPDEQTLLCEAYRLIGEKYVDPVADSTLAAAAALEVDALDEGPSNATGECVIPSDDFVVVCQEWVAEGVPFAVAEEAALWGLMNALDPNSAYLDPAALRMLQEDQAGSVEGIGALVASEDLTAADPQSTPCSVVSEDCRLVVISVFDGSPAEAQGLLAGDVFVAVNGVSIDGWTVDEVTAAVRGQAGTSVSLTVDRDGTELELHIVRASISVPVVESEVVGDVGYLKLNVFTDSSDSQFHDALDRLVAAGIDQLVLDLRDNPGGALFATVQIASEFFSDGVVVRTIGPQDEEVYDADEGGLLADGSLPVAILVNRGSASASEVLSAALQERNRAVVIGANTFGKNTVQQRYGLSNGGALKLTVARWVTAAGNDFGENGVTPDIAADLDEELTVDQLVLAVSDLSGW
ncbi:MAG TPA: S41 family peptidase [Acidimicrobiia bacterium]|nr:S41 family peptidase [Acidimicrobiia bacterium]